MSHSAATYSHSFRERPFVMCATHPQAGSTEEIRGRALRAAAELPFAASVTITVEPASYRSTLVPLLHMHESHEHIGPSHCMHFLNRLAAVAHAANGRCLQAEVP